jgi:Cytochrome c554 and c-prime
MRKRKPRRSSGLRRLPCGGDPPLERVASGPRHAEGERHHGRWRFRQRNANPSRSHNDVFPRWREVHGADRGAGRPKDQGGQRWFPLYPDQILRAGDSLRWTGRDQTWNYQCASCHSTDLTKNYDLAADTYVTSWTDVDVACEACHGPGSRHVAWAAARAAESSGPSQAESNRQPEKGQMGSRQG